jgi:hypothetical protein
VTGTLLLAGCGGAAPGLPRGSDPVELDPAGFTADVDHPYWPMRPGTRWTYREVDEQGSTVTVVVTASTETREIANGVTARVVRDTVTEGGELTKDTITIEPDVLEYKLYARGTGPVLALGVSGGGGREELVGLERVGARAARAAGTAPLGQSYP